MLVHSYIYIYMSHASTCIVRCCCRSIPNSMHMQSLCNTKECDNYMHNMKYKVLKACVCENSIVIHSNSNNGFALSCLFLPPYPIYFFYDSLACEKESICRKCAYQTKSSQKIRLVLRIKPFDKQYKNKPLFYF